MASTLLTNTQQLRDALNGLDATLALPSDSQVVEDRIDEMDAYIISGWGPHPTDTASAQFLLRRQALIMLVGDWFAGRRGLDYKLMACAAIEWRSG